MELSTDQAAQLDETDHDVDDKDNPGDVIRHAWKPDVSHLRNAYEWIGGEPHLLVGVRDKIIIDYSALKAGEFLDTRCWVIDKVGENGYLGLYDPHQKQYGCTNWITGPQRGLLIKIPTGNERLVDTGALSRKGARRAVARALKESEIEEKKKAITAQPKDGPQTLEKRGRGRPKGTLNSRTLERLKAAGHDPTKLSRQQIDEIMAAIRKEEYENAKAEKRRERELKKGKT